MINRIHQALHRPESGWDPVPSSHIEDYAPFAWENLADESVIDWVESVLGSVKAKNVLDLGAGPGQYSVAFARRGADVTWHDVSSGYQSFASRKAAQAGVNISFSLGYLEEAKRLGDGRFDLVFCRSCWYYSAADAPFARLIYELIRPGGCGFVNTPLREPNTVSPARRLQHAVYDELGLKIGHPMPLPGRIVTLFNQLRVEDVHVRKPDMKNEEEILFRKPQTTGPENTD